jgi:hypothetical protein
MKKNFLSHRGEEFTERDGPVLDLLRLQLLGQLLAGFRPWLFVP